MNSKITQTIHCLDVLSVHRFANLLGANIPRAVVRETLSKSSDKYPVVSVKSVVKALNEWGIEILSFKASYETLAELDLPVMAFFQRKKEGYLVVVKSIHSDSITYYSPRSGTVTETGGEFILKWNGVLLVGDYLSKKHRISSTQYSSDTEIVEAELYRKDSTQILDNFFSPEECRYLINYCEENNLFKRSTVQYSKSETVISERRTSFSAFINDRQNSIFVSIYKKVSTILNVPIEHIESLQCVRYGEGEEFKSHFDSGETNHRIHTILVYLNDDFEYGETYFPEIDLKVKPKTGKALYFLNRNENNEILIQSAHAGLPVKGGIKYGCNVWVRDRPAISGTSHSFSEEGVSV